jgi:hypothetical protein
MTSDADHRTLKTLTAGSSRLALKIRADAPAAKARLACLRECELLAARTDRRFSAAGAPGGGKAAGAGAASAAAATQVSGGGPALRVVTTLSLAFPAAGRTFCTGDKWSFFNERQVRKAPPPRLTPLPVLPNQTATQCVLTPATVGLPVLQAPAPQCTYACVCTAHLHHERLVRCWPATTNHRRRRRHPSQDRRQGRGRGRARRQGPGSTWAASTWQVSWRRQKQPCWNWTAVVVAAAAAAEAVVAVAAATQTAVWNGPIRRRQRRRRGGLRWRRRRRRRQRRRQGRRRSEECSAGQRKKPAALPGRKPEARRRTTRAQPAVTLEVEAAWLPGGAL